MSVSRKRNNSHSNARRPAMSLDATEEVPAISLLSDPKLPCLALKFKWNNADNLHGKPYSSVDLNDLSPEENEGVRDSLIAPSNSSTIRFTEQPINVFAGLAPSRSKPVFKLVNFNHSLQHQNRAVALSEMPVLKEEAEEEDGHCRRSLISLATTPSVRFEIDTRLSKGVVNEPSKAVFKESSKVVSNEPSKVVLKESSKSVPNEPSKAVFKESSKVVPNEPSKAVFKESSKVVSNEPSKVVLKESSKSVPNEPSKAVFKESSKVVSNGPTPRPISESAIAPSTHTLRHLAQPDTVDEGEKLEKKPRMSSRKAKLTEQRTAMSRATEMSTNPSVVPSLSSSFASVVPVISGQEHGASRVTKVPAGRLVGTSNTTLAVSSGMRSLPGLGPSSIGVIAGREVKNSQIPPTRLLCTAEDVKFHSNSSKQRLAEATAEATAEVLSRDTLFPSRRKRKLLDGSHNANTLNGHMYSDVLTALGFEVPPKVNEHSYGNFIQALTKQVYKYSLVVNPDKCRIARPRTVDIPSQSMDETVVMFAVTPDYARRFLWESKSYRIFNTLYRHLIPDKEVLEVQVVACVNGDRCEGVSGGIPAPGLSEEDGTPFRGRVLMAFCDPSVNVELEHEKAAGNMCFLCYLSAVMNAAIIRRCQDYDFLRDRVDPIVQFFTPTGPGNYNPITAIYPHEGRPIGLYGPMVMYLPARFSWKYDPTRGYYVDQSYFLCNRLDASLLLADDAPNTLIGTRSNAHDNPRLANAETNSTSRVNTEEPIEPHDDPVDTTAKIKTKKKKKSSQTMANDVINHGQLKK